MPDVIIPGPAGRLEGKYSPAKKAGAPVALVLHAHPRGGGHMETPVSQMLYDEFKERDFSVLRFNFRGVGRSQGVYDQGFGELSDAATALDWAQAHNANAPYCWVAGHSFGAFVGMQLLMRRPEIAGFISVAPPTNMYDFTFLAPCPASGVVVHGESDAIVPPDEMERVMSKVRVQKGIEIERDIIPGASHLFTQHVEELQNAIERYLDRRLGQLNAPQLSPPKRVDFYSLRGVAGQPGAAIRPPGKARATAVVPGKLSGRPSLTRAARKAKASASMRSPRQPTASAGWTGRALASAIRSRRTRFFRPPPHTMRRSGDWGRRSSARAIVRAVRTLSVAAASSVERLATASREKSQRSSDLGPSAVKWAWAR